MILNTKCDFFKGLKKLKFGIEKKSRVGKKHRAHYNSQREMRAGRECRPRKAS